MVNTNIIIILVSGIGIFIFLYMICLYKVQKINMNNRNPNIINRPVNSVLPVAIYPANNISLTPANIVPVAKKVTIVQATRV